MEKPKTCRFHFDEKSKLWLQPFSEILNCMFPIEYVYGEWMWWQALSEARRLSNPDSLTSSSPSEIETGSRVEGFCIPQLLFADSDEIPLHKRKHWQPDLDAMKFFSPFLPNGKIPIFIVEHALDDPRYVHLRFTDEWKEHRPRYKNATFVNHTYLLPLKNWPTKDKDGKEVWSYEMHGPVRKLHSKGFVNYEEDQTGVFKYPLEWPEEAKDWLVRPRVNGWPSPELVQDVINSGCHLAPVGRGKRQDEPIEFLKYHKNPEKASSSSKETHTDNQSDFNVMDETEWRLSFSVAENKLGQSISPVQRHVLVLLKMIKKVYFPDFISSYLLKNLLFWEVEKQSPSFWTEANSAKCLLWMLDQLQKNMEERHLAHYIIPKSNLLQYEDPVKLSEGMAVICDVRINILSNTISMLKRGLSLTYQSLTYLNKLEDLEPLVAKVQDPSLTEEDVERLVNSLLAFFMERSKDVIEKVLEGLQNKDEDENIKEMMYVPLHAYQSFLARNLCKLWSFKSKVPKENTIDEYPSFVKEEVGCVYRDEFIILTQFFFDGMNQGRDLAGLVPFTEALRHTKEVHRKLAWYQVREAQAAFEQQIGWLTKSDLDDIRDKASEKIQENFDNLTMEDLEAEVSKEIQILYEQRHKKKDAEDKNS